MSGREARRMQGDEVKQSDSGQHLGEGRVLEIPFEKKKGGHQGSVREQEARITVTVGSSMAGQSDKRRGRNYEKKWGASLRGVSGRT